LSLVTAETPGQSPRCAIHSCGIHQENDAVWLPSWRLFTLMSRDQMTMFALMSPVDQADAAKTTGYG
jgi:hypothetical protein